MHECMHAKLLQSCLTLCNPIDSSPPGSSVPGILQARTLEWVAISFSNAWKWKVKVKSLNCVRLLATPWTAAYQAPLSMGFSRPRVLEWGAIAFISHNLGSEHTLPCPCLLSETCSLKSFLHTPFRCMVPDLPNSVWQVQCAGLSCFLSTKTHFPL